MPQPLIILSPPRSFSSVVSTMIGQHPQLYGFPELHLFAWNTVDEVIKNEEKHGRPAPPGLIRTLAQEHSGVQNTKTALQALDWVYERRHWSTKELFDYLINLISPKIGVEKSPRTSRKTQYLERAYQIFPDAYYLHLTRHPVSARKSIQAFYRTKKISKKRKVESLRSAIDGFLLWLVVHRNIINFTNSLPVGQTMMIKGENLLSEPDIYLPQIAQWMGLRNDAEAIEAMKHPEESPYAYVGPSPVRGGNDPKFMRHPKLRLGKVKEPSLQTFLEQENWQCVSGYIADSLAKYGLKFASEQAVAREITNLAQLMGYQ